MIKSETVKEIAGALAAFQSEVANVPKESTNPFFKSKYASLEAVIDTVRPTLAKHGLSFVQFPSEQGLTTIILHTSGEYIGSDAKIVIKDQTPQGQGSALTYMRRYALSGALGLATEDDDDGNAATTVKTAPVASQKPTVSLKQRVADALVHEALGEMKTLDSGDSYKDYCQTRTGLELTEANYQAILKALNK